MFPLKGVGTISFKMKKGSMSKLIDGLWVPDLAINQLYVVAIIDQNLQVCFNKMEAITINSKNKIVAKGVKRNNIYELLASMTQVDVGPSRLWHE